MPHNPALQRPKTENCLLGNTFKKDQCCLTQYRYHQQWTKAGWGSGSVKNAFQATTGAQLWIRAESDICVWLQWSRDRQIPRAGHGCSASLVKMSNSKFSDRPCLKNWGRTWLKKMSSVNLGPTHTPTCPYMHLNAFTQTHMSKTEKKDQVGH